jgi:hypothetical protein
VKLEPGPHRLEVRFVGTRWANWLSGVVVAGAIIVAGYVRLTCADVKQWRTPAAVFPSPRFSAIACGAVVAGGVATWSARAMLERSIPHRPPTVTSTRELADAPAVNAFDGRFDTAWMSDGSRPVMLALRETRPRLIRGLRLYPANSNGLYDTWQEMRVSCFLHDWRVMERPFELNNASRFGIIDVTFAEPIAADRMRLEFAKPVLQASPGVGTSRPGFSEIEIVGEHR